MNHQVGTANIWLVRYICRPTLAGQRIPKTSEQGKNKNDYMHRLCTLRELNPGLILYILQWYNWKMCVSIHQGHLLHCSESGPSWEMGRQGSVCFNYLDTRAVIKERTEYQWLPILHLWHSHPEGCMQNLCGCWQLAKKLELASRCALVELNPGFVLNSALHIKKIWPRVLATCTVVGWEIGASGLNVTRCFDSNICNCAII
jgi:hypothetical protein